MNPTPNPTLADFKRQLQNLRELEASGALSAEAVATARASVELELLKWVHAQPNKGLEEPAPPESTTPLPLKSTQSSRLGKRWLAGAGSIAALAAVGAVWIGTTQGRAPSARLAQSAGAAAPLAAATGATPTAAPHSMVSGQIEGMLAGLQARLQAHPEDADGWLMLARSNAVLGRPADAIPAFRKVLALRPADTQAQTGLAEALALQPGGARGG